MLHRMNSVPDGLLDCPADQLLSVIPDSTLLCLRGALPEAVFLSVLLHGNEPTGLVVAQNILKKYAAPGLPRSLYLFIGNVHAASEHKRRLDGQPDFNRIWLERQVDGETDIHRRVRELMHEMAQQPLFASIDIHNNTGINPHYACINRLGSPFLNLARKFARTMIYFVRPSGVQSKAFSHLCPAVTLECGKVGDEFGIQLATAFVDEVLNMKELPDASLTDGDIDLFHTLAVVKIPEHIAFSFDGSDADISFIGGMESLNFEEIPAGTTLARVREGVVNPILVLDEDGQDITWQLFDIVQGSLVNRIPLMPSMLTLDARVIRQDCLCYVMERYFLSMGEKIADDDSPVWVPDSSAQ